MKTKVFSKILTLLLVFACVFSLSAIVQAADASVSFEVTEDGINAIVFKPGSVFTDTDLFDNFKCVMPGDERIENITVKNEVPDCDYIKIWLRAVAHDAESNPLSPEALSQLTADERRNGDPEIDYMQDFLSQLSLEVFNGDESIYSASPDKTDSLTESVYLGMIKKGESLELKAVLTAPDDLGNDYSNRIGEVDWVFKAECFNEFVPPPEDDTTTLTVRKIWEDDGKDRPEQINVQLLRDGEPFAEIILSEANQWTYTWDKLSKKHEWSVREPEVPDGYESSISITGNIAAITNFKPSPPSIPTEPVDLTVVKTWEDNGSKRPDSVSVTLYNGKAAVESVQLGEWNNWTHTWQGLDGNGNWQVIETDIPKGYVPSYSKSSDVVTIKNTGSLIVTGQLDWPVPVFGGLGLLLLAFGIYIIRRRKNENA